VTALDSSFEGDIIRARWTCCVRREVRRWPQNVSPARIHKYVSQLRRWTLPLCVASRNRRKYWRNRLFTGNNCSYGRWEAPTVKVEVRTCCSIAVSSVTLTVNNQWWISTATSYRIKAESAHAIKHVYVSGRVPCIWVTQDGLHWHVTLIFGGPWSIPISHKAWVVSALINNCWSQWRH